MNEDKTENNLIVFVFNILVLSALGGIIYATNQHMLSYLQLQWLSAVGLGFMFVFLLKEVLILFFTEVYEGLKKTKDFFFGKEEDKIELENLKALEKQNDDLLAKTMSMQKNIDLVRSENGALHETISKLEKDLGKKKATPDGPIQV